MRLPHIKPQNTQSGFTLLIAILVAGIVLAIGVSILRITLKEFQLSGIVSNSEAAFYAADTGIECAFYWDDNSRDSFNVTSPAGSVDCVDTTVSVTGGTGFGATRTFTLQWGSPQVCATVEVTKDDNSTRASCPVGVTCTTLVSKGHNDCDTNDSRTVERTIRARY
jgi:Tfp pilus assembly protein PilX